MAIDVNELIAQAKAARADAVAQEKKLAKANAKAKAAGKANAEIKAEVDNKLNYANALRNSITDYEGKLEAFAIKIARDGKLDPVDQKEFDRVVSQYSQVSNTYDTTVREADTLLANAPSPTKTVKKDGKLQVAPTKEQVNLDAVKKGESPDTTANAANIASINADLDKKTKNAYDLFYNMDSAQRRQWQKALNDAGYPTLVTDEFSPDVVSSYTALLGAAKSFNNQGKNVTNFVPKDLNDFLTYKTTLYTQTKQGTGGPTVTAYKSSPTDAAVIINNVFNRELGRRATQQEINALLPALNAFELANPRVAGKTTVSSAGNPEEYIRQLVAGEAKVKGKKITGLVDSLTKEYTTKKTDKTQVALDSIRKTAMNNGYPLNDIQLKEFEARLKNGESVDVIQKSIRNSLANGAYANNKGIAESLKAGDDLATIYAPYRQTMASILELPYDKISLTDPTLTQAIGTSGNLSLTEYQNMLRKDPRWQYTNNARETVSNGLTQVLRDFGFMG